MSDSDPWGSCAAREDGRRGPGMTPEEMGQATGLGPDWRLLWMDADHRRSVPHICWRPDGPGGSDTYRVLPLAYAPTAMPGVEVATCGRCRMAWVRAAKP